MIIADYVKSTSLRFIIVLATAEMLFSATYFPAHAQQTLRFDSPNSCGAQGGTVAGINRITDFANGTFGEEPSGAPNQSPATNPFPFPNLITGGNYVPFFSPAFGFGDYAILSNAFEPRNAFQHREITDPLNGVTGRFFGSDPDNDMAPTLNFAVTDVIPNENFELSFWAANSEPNGTPNVLVAVVDGIESFSTGPLPAFPDALEWRRHAFVFNAGNRSTIELSIASTIDGQGGLDFYIDNVEMRACTLVGGIITGTIFGDSNGNDVFETGTDGPLAGISVQLWDTQGDGDPSNDIFVSVTESDSSGLYKFQNIAAGNDYTVRVVVNDPDLPTGAVPGTPVALGPFAVTNGNMTDGQDFGFDLTEAALEAFKTVALFDSETFAVPSTDVVYSISIINRGDGSVTNDSVFLLDRLPSEVIFFNDPLAPAINFTQSGAGLSFDPANDVRYALTGPQPANFDACTYTPTPGYDPLVGFVCFNPKGEMAAGTPDPTVTFSFRARVK